MRKEFESELAKRVSEKRGHTKAWAIVVLVAGILVAGMAAVTIAAAAGTGDKIQLKDQDQLKDGSCDDAVCDPVLEDDGICDNVCTCDCDGDGICDYDSDGDGICDLCEDCTCVEDCPCA